MLFWPNVADKYALTVIKNLGLRCNFWQYSAGHLFITNPSFKAKQNLLQP